jgi:hypothetical protein
MGSRVPEILEDWRSRNETAIPSICLRFAIIQSSSRARFPTTDAGKKKFYWCLVAPTDNSQKPFGRLAEGLFFLNSCRFSARRTVFNRSSISAEVFSAIGCKTLLPQDLVWFKRIEQPREIVPSNRSRPVDRCTGTVQ